MLPDARYVGVAVDVGSEYANTANEVIEWLQAFFNHYELPVKYVKPEIPPVHDKCLITFFVNGMRLSGDLPYNYFSLVFIRDQHKMVFEHIRVLYDRANFD